MTLPSELDKHFIIAAQAWAEHESMMQRALVLESDAKILRVAADKQLDLFQAARKRVLEILTTETQQ